MDEGTVPYGLTSAQPRVESGGIPWNARAQRECEVELIYIPRANPLVDGFDTVGILLPGEAPSDVEGAGLGGFMGGFALVRRAELRLGELWWSSVNESSRGVIEEMTSPVNAEPCERLGNLPLRQRGSIVGNCGNLWVHRGFGFEGGTAFVAEKAGSDMAVISGALNLREEVGQFLGVVGDKHAQR